MTSRSIISFSVTSCRQADIALLSFNMLWTSFIPSTREVKSVIVAAFRRPAGRVTPILSSLSLSARPPFFDLALRHTLHTLFDIKLVIVLRSVCPSISGGNRRWVKMVKVRWMWVGDGVVVGLVEGLRGRERGKGNNMLFGGARVARGCCW